MRVLIVEDEAKMAGLLRRGLVREGIAVDLVGEGEEALWKAEAVSYDAIVLDLMLPGIDGFEVCRRLRDDGVISPILMLTARDGVPDRVAGLDAGADDYLVKPFRLSELLARVRSHLRRTGDADRGDEAVEVGAFKVDRAARRAWQDGAELSLRPKEFELLALLVAQAGRVVTRQRIMDEVWQTEWMGSTKTLDTHILALRQKIGSDAITTLRGVGYRLELP